MLWPYRVTVNKVVTDVTFIYRIKVTCNYYKVYIL